MAPIRLNNILMCSCDDQMQIEIYEDTYSKDTLVDLENARMEELAFQPVTGIMLLVGDDDDPEPSLGIIIDSKTIELTPEIMMPEPPTLLGFLDLLDPETRIEIVDTFKKTDRVFHFMLRSEHPDPPVIQIDTASQVITMMTPSQPE